MKFEELLSREIQRGEELEVVAKKEKEYVRAEALAAFAQKKGIITETKPQDASDPNQQSTSSDPTKRSRFQEFANTLKRTFALKRQDSVELESSKVRDNSPDAKGKLLRRQTAMVEMDELTQSHVIARPKAEPGNTPISKSTFGFGNPKSGDRFKKVAELASKKQSKPSMQRKNTLERSELIEMQVIPHSKLLQVKNSAQDLNTDPGRGQSFNMLRSSVNLPEKQGSRESGPRRSITVSPSPFKVQLSKDDHARIISEGVKSIHHRRRSLYFSADLDATEAQITFYQRVLFKKLKILSSELKKTIRTEYENLVSRQASLNEKKIQREQFLQTMIASQKPKGYGPWELLWVHRRETFKKTSPYADFSSYRIRQMIIKGGDDLRQEMFVMQLIKKMKECFNREGLGLFVYTYDIIPINSNSGALEFIHDSISLDGLKKKYPGNTLIQIYKLVYGKFYEDARKNFTASLAAYSVICFVLQIKDRHNGNILIDADGHLIHIDYGFILTKGPKIAGMIFESSPFKFTTEYMELLGGTETSPLYLQFRSKFLLGLLALRKNLSELCDLIDMMSRKSALPCFEKFDIQEFVDRLKPNKTDAEFEAYADGIYRKSYDNYRTNMYDQFQRFSNNIAY